MRRLVQRAERRLLLVVDLERERLRLENDNVRVAVEELQAAKAALLDKFKPLLLKRLPEETAKLIRAPVYSRSDGEHVKASLVAQAIQGAGALER